MSNISNEEVLKALMTVRQYCDGQKCEECMFEAKKRMNGSRCRIMNACNPAYFPVRVVEIVEVESE